jgi:hypothetical protein
MAAGVLALVLAGILALAIIIAFPSVLPAILKIMGGTFILMLGVALVALLIIAIFDINIDPLVRQTAVLMTRHRLVDFFALFPDRYEVRQVNYVDTDGDEQEEWVVFYQFDLADGRRPYAGVVYDYDRGDPVAMFPYRLLPPDRDYLSEGVVRLEFKELVGASEATPMPELFVYGEVPAPEEDDEKMDTDLTIFRHIPNSFDWEFPRDEPRRYQVIGSFRGDGGVSFDEETETVTVRNRAGYERSQLAVESVYVLDNTRETYMSVEDPQQLMAPASSQVVFTFGVPADVLSSPYPEKVVLGFYEMLAAKTPSIPPRDFLTGQALIEFDKNNLAYFGFEDLTGRMTDVNQVKITQLSYAPDVEQVNPQVSVLGEDPRLLTVKVAFEGQVGKADTYTQAPIQWVTRVVNGLWKIDYRLE